MKRVFTLGFAASQLVTSPGDDAGLDTLLVAQEDIVVIGYQMTTKMGIANRLSGEGMVDCDWVLTTSGLPTGGGVLGWLDVEEHCEEFTAGAGLTIGMPAQVVMFPVGYGFTMREGEVLSIYHSMHAVEHAGDVHCVCDGTIYYVKGRAV